MLWNGWFLSVYNEATINCYTKIQYGDKLVGNITGPFSWEYAVVKYGEN
jgi:hypothetical protein